MVDNKTAHLALPLPDLSNMQDEDVPRIGQALQKVDAYAQGVDAALQTQGNEVQKLKSDNVDTADRLVLLAQAVEKESVDRAAADDAAAAKIDALSDEQEAIALRVDGLDTSSVEQDRRLSAAESEVTSLATTLIGSIQTIICADSYVPNGCVPANGGEYTRAQFPALFDDYLAGGKLLTCTYATWAAQVALTGNCARFALDVDAKKFKVPFLKDGDSITQAASASELAKSVKAGLPNATGYIGAVLTFGSAGSGAVKTVFNRENSYYPAGGTTTQDVAIDLSRGNPIYGNSTTVTDEQVRLRHFVVLASAQNSASVFDWSNYMAALAGKANTDLTNATGNAISQYLHVCDEKPAGTSGGSTTGGTWQTRDLNTIKVNRINGSLENNRIILPGGRYYIRATVPMFAGNSAKAALFNYTSGLFLLFSSSAFADYSYNGHPLMLIEGEFTLADTARLELQMWVQTSYTYGMGRAAAISGITEKYSEAIVWKM